MSCGNPRVRILRRIRRITGAVAALAIATTLALSWLTSTLPYKTTTAVATIAVAATSSPSASPSPIASRPALAASTATAATAAPTSVPTPRAHKARQTAAPVVASGGS